MPHLLKETLVNNMRKLLTTLLKTLMTLFLRTSLCAAAPVNTNLAYDRIDSEYTEEDTNVANGVIEVNGVRLQQSETVQNSIRDDRSFKMRFGDITNTPIDISFGNIMTGVNPHKVQNGAWSSYGPCSKICGGGMKERSCSKHVPGSRGSSCRGSARSSCNTQPCGRVSKLEAIKTFKATVQAVADGLCNVEASGGSKRYSWIHLFSEDEKKLLDILAEGTKYVQTTCSSNEGNCQLKTMEGFVEMLTTTFYRIKSTGKCSPGFGRYVGEMKTTFDLVAWVAEEYEARGGNSRGLGLVNNEGFGTTNSGGSGTSNSEGWSLQNNGGSRAASSNEFNKVNYGGAGVTNNGGFGTTNSGGSGTSNSEGWGLLNNGGSTPASSNEFSKVNHEGLGVTNNGGFGTTISGGWTLQNNGGSSAVSSNEFNKVNYGGVGVTNNGGFALTNSGGFGTTNNEGWSLQNNGGSTAASSNEFNKVNYGGVGITNNGGFALTNSGGTSSSEGWSLQNNGGSSAASSNEFNKVNYGGVRITNNGGFALTNSGGTSNSEGWSLLNNGGSSAASSNEFSKVNYGGVGVTKGGGWNLANRGGLDKASFGGLGTTKSGGMGVKNNGGLDILNQGGWGTASDGGSRNVNTGGSATASSGGSGFVNNGGFSISNRGFRQSESGGLGSLNSGGMEVENNGGFSMSNHGGSSTSNNGEWNLLNNGGVSMANNGVFSKVNHGGLGTVKSGGKHNGGLGTARSGGSGGVNNGGFTISIQRNGGSGAPNDGGLEVAYNGPDTTNSGKWNLPNHGGLNAATHGGFNKANLGGLSSAGNGGFGPTNNGGFGATSNGGFGKVNPGGFATANYGGLGAAIHGGWSEYGPCSTSCGGGTKTRSCSNPSPSHGGNHCTGSSTWSCNTQPCPTIHAGWSAWTKFSACTATCGPATKTRRRTCSHSPSYGGGSLCQGSHEETSYCDLISCGSIGGKKLVRDKSAIPSTVEIQWPQPDQCLFGCKEKYLLVDYHEDGKKGVNPVMKVYVAKDQLHPPDEFSTSGHMELLHFGSVPFEEHDVEAMFYVLHPKGWKPTQRHFKTPELSEFVSAAAHTAVSVSAVFLAGAAIGSVVWPVGILAKAAVGGASAIFGMAATKIFDEVHETFLHCIGF